MMCESLLHKNMSMNRHLLCRITNGSCAQGCSAGWRGELCKAGMTFNIANITKLTLSTTDTIN